MGTSQESPMFQRRRAERVRVNIPARYVSRDLQLDGRITDLSTDGCFFSAEFLDQRGEFAELELVLPTAEGPTLVRGEVRWVRDTPRGGGMGIRLVDVALDVRAKLAALVEAAKGGLSLGAEGALASAP